MGAWDSWIGRSETLNDTVDRDRIDGLSALFDRPSPTPETLPFLAHWLLFRPNVPQHLLDRDGHPRRSDGGLLPPVPLPRRMWAGGDMAFLAPIPVGAQVQRRSTVTAITEKSGRSGEMVFVTVEHEVLHADVVAIRERQDIVYREASTGPFVAVKVEEPHDHADAVRMVTPDPIQLFRYSALTFNGHRIHYDREYAREVEGYPGLVVHGPYIATLLIDHVQRSRPDADIVGLSFRAKSPLFDTAPFELCLAGQDVWARHQDGGAAMVATVRTRA